MASRLVGNIRVVICRFARIRGILASSLGTSKAMEQTHFGQDFYFSRKIVEV
jgi:hypothetical protein